jgi:hypothetical protein
MIRVMSTTRKYLAFDIETARVVPSDAADWHSHRPLGISCAATLSADADQPRLWHGGDRSCPADRMGREEAAALVRYLEAQVASGFTLLTWNGLGFDWASFRRSPDSSMPAAVWRSPTWT